MGYGSLLNVLAFEVVNLALIAGQFNYIKQ